MEAADASDPRLLRVERKDEATGTKFTFLFNRTHGPVETSEEGEPIVTSLAKADGGKLTIGPNGVVVVKR